MAVQPTGTVTLLFTDIEGSTQLLQRLGTERYREALDLHRRLLREAFDRHGGYEVDCEGDAFFVAFASAGEAVAAAGEAQRALAAAEWPEEGEIRVRMGVHTGEPLPVPPKYVGLDVHHAARVMAAGHGGQVLLSRATRDLVDFVVRDLGDHRLKDLSGAERLFQVGEAQFPPLKTLYQTNLPVQPNELVGRQQELEEVSSFVRGGCRLLTLTGTGGTGKTRLALHAAAELTDEFPDGVWFVPLAPLTDVSLFEASLSEAVGGGGDVREELRSKRLLLVLDNLEQLPNLGGLIAELLVACPEVRVLATSRERLGVSMEQEYAVSPLPVEDAVALFLARARLLKHDFEPHAALGEIARRLDGLPLAIELAAARVKVLTPSQILERLGRSIDVLGGGARDLPDRQRTLQATIDWSYQLLEPPEQELWQRLAVFAGTFDLDAAERIAGADLETLGSLVDKSLVRQSHEGRFLMLQLLREYASARLVESGQAEKVALKHASYYADMAVWAEPELHSSRQQQTLERLDDEHSNIRRAVEWSLDAGAHELALTLAGKLFRYWDVRGFHTEGCLIERALAASPLEPTLPRADALLAVSFLTYRVQRDPAAAALRMSQAEQSIEIYRALQNPIGVARGLNNLATAYYEVGPLSKAKTLLQEALSGARANGDDYYVVMASSNLADIALREGEFSAAATLAREAATNASSSNLGLADVEAIAVSNLAHALARRKDPAAAETGQTAVRLSAKLGFVHILCGAFLVLAAALADALPERAATVLGASDALLETLESAVLDMAEAQLHDDIQQVLVQALGLVKFEQAVQRGREFDRESAVEFALNRP